MSVEIDRRISNKLSITNLIKEVYSDNLAEELPKISSLLNKYNYVAMVNTIILIFS